MDKEPEDVEFQKNLEEATRPVREVDKTIREAGRDGITIEEISEKTGVDKFLISIWIDTWGRLGKMGLIKFPNDSPAKYFFLEEKL